VPRLPDGVFMSRCLGIRSFRFDLGAPTGFILCGTLGAAPFTVFLRFWTFVVTSLSFPG
jgi:hypothetical protein